MGKLKFLLLLPLITLSFIVIDATLAVASNDAQYVSTQTCPPAYMATGQTANVVVTMKNTGTSSWNTTGNYRLGSQNPQDNITWGSDKARIPVVSTVASGNTKDFRFTVTAPSTVGTYNFQWKMVQDGIAWFGQYSPNCTVKVISLSAECLLNGTQGKLTWTADPNALTYAVRIYDTAVGWNNTCEPNDLYTGSICNSNVTTNSYTFTSTKNQTNLQGHTYGWWIHSISNTGIYSTHVGGPALTCYAPAPTPTPTPTPPTSSYSLNCPAGINPIRISAGLLSTSDPLANTNNKFSTTSACIIDSRATIPAFSIPTYAEMKAIYYDKNKPTTVTKRDVSENSTNNFTATSINDLTIPANNQYLINIPGNLTLDEAISVKNKTVIVIFVNGNLNINADQTYDINNNKHDESGLVFVVSGNVNVAPAVIEINAYIITSGRFCSASNTDGTCPTSPVTASKLTINGSVIALNSANPPKFVRSLANNTNPAEEVVYQPKYLVILKDIFSKTLSIWKEIQ